MKWPFLMRKSLFLFTAIVAIAWADASADVVSDINTYMKLFKKENIPTLADYYHAYTSESEDELAYELSVCKRSGWGVPKRNGNGDENICSKYMKERDLASAKTPSAYLSWLRTQVPLSVKVKIGNIRTIYEEDKRGKYPPYQRIYANLNGIHVVFLRSIDEEDRGVEPIIRITEIEGKSVDTLYKLYLENLNQINSK